MYLRHITTISNRQFIIDLSRSIDELQTGIKQMKNNKSPGRDGFPYEVSGGNLLFDKIFEQVTLMWKNEKIPGNFQESIISILFGKGKEIHLIVTTIQGFLYHLQQVKYLENNW